MKRKINAVALKDALNNFTPRSGADDDYCKGLLVGVVAGLMATGLTWEDAMAEVRNNWPRDAREINDSTCPESWQAELRA